MQRPVPEVVQDGVLTDADQRCPDQLAVWEREHEATMRVAKCADRIVEDHPARRVQEEAGNRQALLLVERQLSVPATTPSASSPSWRRQ